MVSVSQQEFIRAPTDEVFDLVADPDRQTEWWPDTIVFECDGEELAPGCRIRNVQSRPWPLGDLETTLEVTDFVPGREVTIRCLDTGTFTRATLTGAQDGTFVEWEAGNDPKGISMRIMDATIGRSLFRRWVEHAVDAVKQAAESRRA